MEVGIVVTLKKKIYILLLIGGAIVAASFSVVLIFGQGTWKSWWLANILHFIGGGYAVFFVRTLFQYAKLQYRIILPWWMEIWIYVGGSLILGVFWEWYELGIDRYVLFVLKGQSKMSYADNIGDLIIDFMGAVAAALFISKENKSRKGRKATEAQ